MSTQLRVDAASEPGELRSIPNFTGPVSFFEHTDPGAHAGVNVLTVRFARGAATEWHHHLRGQYLESIAGDGWVQDLGGERIPLAPRSRIWCPPMVTHRHGAAEGSRWLQFSITPGQTVWESDDAVVAAMNEEEVGA